MTLRFRTWRKSQSETTSTLRREQASSLNSARKKKNSEGKIRYAKPVVIEDGVWLGGNVTVWGGVTIGKNSIIGAGSVVTADIPENVIAVGNPAKVIKKIEAD